MTRRADHPSTAGRLGARLGVAAAVATIAAVLVATWPVATVFADSAGPTDYRTEVVAITPPVDGIDVEIEGGDAFVVLTVSPGTEVLVTGYEGEPYLWFRPDGTVAENRTSPATFANTDRFGGDVPASASADAEPVWAEVASGGRFAWHDHRAHRMDPSPPVNAVRGEPVLDGVVPLVVDGVDVDVRVVATWMPSPSRWPATIGVILGTTITALLQRWRRGLAAVLIAAAATATGAAQYASLPAVTDPSPWWWIVPAVALGVAVVGLAVGRGPVRDACGAIAGLQLLGWAVPRRDHLWRAVLPTDLTPWLDRGVTAAVLAGAIVVAVTSLAALVAPLRPVRATRTSAPTPTRTS